MHYIRAYYHAPRAGSAVHALYLSPDLGVDNCCLANYPLRKENQQCWKTSVDGRKGIVCSDVCIHQVCKLLHSIGTSTRMTTTDTCVSVSNISVATLWWWATIPHTSTNPCSEAASYHWRRWLASKATLPNHAPDHATLSPAPLGRSESHPPPRHGSCETPMLAALSFPL